MKCLKKIALVTAAVMGLSGCTAMNTAVKKRNLEVKTQMSDTIWLDPVESNKRTVFLQMRNTTDKQIDIHSALSQKLKEKGYKVTSNPDDAHYWIQTNILKLEKMDLAEAQSFMSSGYGSAIGAGTLAALATATRSSNQQSIIGGGLIGAAIGFAADSLVEDVNFSMITDVRIVEKTENAVKANSTAALKNGNSGETLTTTTIEENKKRFQTRVMSNANQMNLDFEEAQPVLIDGLVTSISGIF